MWYYARPTMQTKSHDKGLEESILNDEASCFYDVHLTLSELADLTCSCDQFTLSCHLIHPQTRMISLLCPVVMLWHLHRIHRILEEGEQVLLTRIWCLPLSDRCKFKNKNILRWVSLFWLRKWGRKYDRQKRKN